MFSHVMLGCSDRVRLQRLARLTLDRSLTVRQLEALVRDEEQALSAGQAPRRARRSKWNIDPDAGLVDRLHEIGAAALAASTAVIDAGAVAAPSRLAFMPGRPIGSYELVGQLGAGAMGEVYRARDTRLNRDVALKVVAGHFAENPNRLARFRREAQLLAVGQALERALGDLPAEWGIEPRRG